MTLPTFQHNEDGIYTLIYGIFDSTGSPYADLYDENNNNSVTIHINTELDITIDNLYPSHNPSETTYLYGQNMVSVAISNNGNTTATNFTLELSITEGVELPIIQYCNIVVLNPNQQRTCVFDMPVHGYSIDIQATLPSQIENNFDSNILDNTIQEIADIEVAQLASSITIDNEKEWYTDNEQITVTANVNAFSAGPVNYSWWYSGIINIDYGHEVTINTTDFGLGSHTFKLITSDILGNSEIIYFSILVYSEISATNEPFYTASATSPSNTVEITHDYVLPTERQDYNVGGGKIPLMLYQFDLIDTSDGNSIFDGQNWLDVEFNLDYIIPNSVPYSSVEFRKLNSFEDQNWEYFNPEHYGYLDQSSMYIRLYEPTTILVIGTLVNQTLRHGTSL